MCVYVNQGERFFDDVKEETDWYLMGNFGFRIFAFIVLY